MPSAAGTRAGKLPLVVWVLAVGSALAATALDSSPGLTGPALVGALAAAPTLLPLITLALAGVRNPTRIVARRTAPVRVSGGITMPVSSRH
ncbi:hypothetical protein [Streptomyces sp. bgisy095]|uniref:hypothetical protein n=1 Tax=unclassified Streptomyces TaxID=2593676 RepID=UPI003D70A7F1